MRQYFPLLTFACLLATPACAQAPTDKVKIEVTRAELQAIGNALMKAPYETSAPIMNSLQLQLQEIDRPKPSPEPAKPAEDKPKQ